MAVDESANGGYNLGMTRRPTGGAASPRPGGKEATSYRLAPETRERVRRLAEALNIAQSAVIELAVRKLARSEGVE